MPRSAPRASKARRPRWWLRILIALAALVGIGIAGVAVVVAMTDVPDPSEVATSEATIVYWSDGVTELGRLGDATRRSVPLSDVPIDVQNAVLAAEDRDFYNHGGISPIAIVRAAVNNIRGSGGTQGGSTITQQYAKNAYLSQERSWDRKLREMLLAFKLETTVSKNEILANYLNTSYFGRGAYGIEAASLAYFGVPARELTFEQGAVLAAVLKSPSTLEKAENRDALRARWAYVLDGMVQQGWITPEQEASAIFPKLAEPRTRNRLGGQVGFLLQAVTDELIARGFDETEIQVGGLRITSTFDRDAQRAAQQAVRREGPKEGTDGLRIGLASVRPGTGEVVALYGGRDFIDDQINNATRDFAQAGSTFKPFALAAGLENGITLGSVWDGNSPTTVADYTFENYGNRSFGDVTLLQATEFSINSSYVLMEDQIGVDSVVDATLRAGIPDDTPGLNLESPDLTFVLGTASPSALDMAGAYATFAASGVHAEPTVIKRVLGPNDGVLYEGVPTTEQAFSPEVANTVTYALAKVVTSGTGRTALALERPAAGKTGTTDDNKSAWFVGYTPQLATAVLMAKEAPDGTPVSMEGVGGMTSVTGGSFPAAMWTSFMAGALGTQPVTQFPEPPAEALEGTNCPIVMPEDGVIPAGCPIPEIAEFNPNETDPTDLPAPSIDPDLMPSEELATGEPAAEPSGDTEAPVPGQGQGQGQGEGQPKPTPTPAATRQEPSGDEAAPQF